MSSCDKKTLTQILKKATSAIEKKLYFLGWLNMRLAELGAKEFPVLVGGSAVAFYTAGNYATQDIDIVYGVSEKLNAILLPEGFLRMGATGSTRNSTCWWSALARRHRSGSPPFTLTTILSPTSHW